MTHPFDFDEAFGDDYLHFARQAFDDDHDDDDARAVLAHTGLSAGQSVLDAPCGYGRVAVRLASVGLTVTGVDRSERFLDEARELATSRGVVVDLCAGDLRALPVDGPFDAVVCWFTSFGYFADEDNRQVLREFHRVLRPGGTLVIDTLSHDGFVREFTEAPELVVTEHGQDIMIDRSEFDVSDGCVVTHRTTIRDGSRRDARYFIRLLTIPEWRVWLGDAGFADVAFSDRDGDAVDLGTWRIVVRATA